MGAPHIMIGGAPATELALITVKVQAIMHTFNCPVCMGHWRSGFVRKHLAFKIQARNESKKLKRYMQILLLSLGSTELVVCCHNLRLIFPICTRRQTTFGICCMAITKPLILTGDSTLPESCLTKCGTFSMNSTTLEIIKLLSPL